MAVGGNNSGGSVDVMVLPSVLPRTIVPNPNQGKRDRLKAIVESLGESVTADEIREHAYQVGFGKINSSMLSFVRSELWPDRSKPNASRAKRPNISEFVMPEGYVDALTCPACKSNRTTSGGLRKKPDGERGRRRDCKDCDCKWWPALVGPFNRAATMRARAVAAVAKTCTTCKETKPAEYFGKVAGDEFLLRSSCRLCLNRKRAESQLAKMLNHYGLTWDSYLAMLRNQGDVCAICKNPESTNRVKWVPLNIDHCHKTGRVRGLLCTKCNLGVGNFNDEATRLEEALAYLKRHEQQPN